MKYSKYFAFLFLFMLFFAHCEKKNSNPGRYNSGDTIFNLNFGNRELKDQTPYGHIVKTNAPSEYMEGVDSGFALFFDGRDDFLSVELDYQDSLELSFFYAPFTLLEGATMMDYAELISVSTVNTGFNYVDAYSAATYTLAAVNPSMENTGVQLEQKPYPMTKEFFSRFDIWVKLSMKMVPGKEVVLHVNGFETGTIAMPLVKKNTPIILTFGCSSGRSNFFTGKIDNITVVNL